MSINTREALLEFHTAFNLRVRLSPFIPVMDHEARMVLESAAEDLAIMAQALHNAAATDNSGVLLRFQLMVEELGEVASAVFHGDVGQVLHEMVDVRYVTDGTLVEWGLKDVFPMAFARVHMANMAKLGPDGKPILNEAGRVVKPEGWRKANMEGLV
jgi:predicted HAD superfamily Cof-like phosphohydrolase